jgi:hypothetical protein
MMSGVGRMAMCHMGVVRTLLVVAGGVMLRGLAMVVRCVVVMLGGRGVVLGTLMS